MDHEMAHLNIIYMYEILIIKCAQFWKVIRASNGLIKFDLDYNKPAVWDGDIQTKILPHCPRF